jgi:hypothetical protein
VGRLPVDKRNNIGVASEKEGEIVRATKTCKKTMLNFSSQINKKEKV